jgi:hypothetical protein
MVSGSSDLDGEVSQISRMCFYIERTDGAFDNGAYCFAVTM